MSLLRMVTYGQFGNRLQCRKFKPTAVITTCECYGWSGTGGFLSYSFDHAKDLYVKTAEDYNVLQKQIHGVEKKQLLHLLCITNMLLHGIEVPVQVKHANTLNRPLSSWDDDEQKDVIITNPPFDGTDQQAVGQLPWGHNLVLLGVAVKIY